MTLFSIWANKEAIQTLQLIIVNDDDTVKQVHELKQGKNDIWSIDLPEAGSGTLYKFGLNGDENDTFPDPRSGFQPRGVHGPSMVVSHDYDWKVKSFEAAPLPKALIYELHVGTFTDEGTYDAAIEKLDDLAKLGVNYVGVLPLAEASGERNWGYDGVDIFAPYHPYGSPERLKNSSMPATSGRSASSWMSSTTISAVRVTTLASQRPIWQRRVPHGATRSISTAKAANMSASSWSTTR